MPDGPKQEARDEVFLSQLGKDKLRGPFPSRWTCPEVQPWLYGYNAFEEVKKAVQKEPFRSKAAVPSTVESSMPVSKRISSLFSALTKWLAI
jgi:salicylate hydroxylase